MGDVISSYIGKNGKNHKRFVTFLLIFLLLFSVFVYILFRPWIQDTFTYENNNIIFGFGNVGSVRDRDLQIEVNCTKDVSCGFTTDMLEGEGACYRSFATGSDRTTIVVKCNVLYPMKNVKITCNMVDSIINVTLKSRYQFLKRNYVCSGGRCKNDESLLTGPIPNIVNYISTYWGDRLTDLTEWAQKV